MNPFVLLIAFLLLIFGWNYFTGWIKTIFRTLFWLLLGISVVWLIAVNIEKAPKKIVIGDSFSISTQAGVGMVVKGRQLVLGVGGFLCQQGWCPDLAALAFNGPFKVTETPTPLVGQAGPGGFQLPPAPQATSGPGKSVPPTSTLVPVDPTTPKQQSELEAEKKYVVDKTQAAFPCGEFCSLAPDGFSADIYYPVSDGSHPALAFSTGMLSSGAQIGESLSARGYIVVIPKRVIKESVDIDEGIYLLTESLKLLNRLNDEKGSVFYQKVDLGKGAGVAGYSLGGGVVLFIPNRTDFGIKIVARVVVNPVCIMEQDETSLMAEFLPKIGSLGINPLDPTGSVKEKFAIDLDKMDFDKFMQRCQELPGIIQNSTIPTAYILASEDILLEKEKGFYGSTVSPKGLFGIKGGNQTQLFGDQTGFAEMASKMDNPATISAEQQLSISVNYASAWFDYYLKSDDEGQKVILNAASDPSLSVFEYKKE